MSWLKKMNTRPIYEAFTYDRPDLPAAFKVIFQLFLVVCTTLLTMYFVPHFQQQFEKNERKSQFYASVVNELNGDTKELLGKISVLVTNDISSNKKENIYIDVRVSTTKLHWRSVEFGIIFEGSDIEGEILNYQKSLSKLEQELKHIYKEPKDGMNREAIENFAYHSAHLLHALAKKADIVIKEY